MESSSLDFSAPWLHHINQILAYTWTAYQRLHVTCSALFSRSSLAFFYPVTYHHIVWPTLPYAGAIHRQVSSSLYWGHLRSTHYYWRLSTRWYQESSYIDFILSCPVGPIPLSCLTKAIFHLWHQHRHTQILFTCPSMSGHAYQIQI